MACIFMSGAEWGNLIEMNKWGGSYSIVSDRVRSGSYAYKCDNVNSYLGFSVPGSPQEVYIQFASNWNRFELNPIMFKIKSAYGTQDVLQLQVTSSGQILVWVQNPDDLDSGTLRAASSARMAIDTWHVIEVHFKADQNFGIFELRVDGVFDCTWYGWTSYYQTIDLITFGPSPTGWGQLDFEGDQWIDDIVVNDTTGSYNYDWPGCIKVVLLRPNEVGDQTEWTASREPWNYDNVNDAPPDSTDYVYTYDIGDVDLYGHENLPSEADTVPIVRSDAWAFKNSGLTLNTRTLIFPVKPAGESVTDSPGQELRTQYSLIQYVWDVNPATDSVWTRDEVNNLQAGLKSGT